MTDPSPAARNPIILCRTCGQRATNSDNHVYDYCDVIGVVIQEVIPGEVVAEDARILPGDQIVQVNSRDLRDVPHSIAREALCAAESPLRLTVYREKQESKAAPFTTKVLQVSLTKVTGVPLGIKIAAKQSEQGIYIMEVLESSLARRDGRLKSDDRVLQINGFNVEDEMPERVARIIRDCGDRVEMVVSRQVQVTTPEVIQGPPAELPTEPFTLLRHALAPKVRAEKTVNIKKGYKECMGISVSGGKGQRKGDVPIFITGIQADGCVARHGQLKVGSFTSLIEGILREIVSGGKGQRKGDVPIFITGIQADGCVARHGQLKVGSFTSLIEGILREIVSGGKGQRKGDVPIFITGIQADGCVARHGQLKVGSFTSLIEGSLRESVSGGKGQRKGDVPIFITGIQADGCVARHGQLKVGSFTSLIEGILREIVSGGKGQRKGDVPIFITGIQADGCVARHGQLKKGDILLSVNGTSLLDLPHTEAVKVLKESANARSLTLSVIEGDTDPDNETNGYIPSWLTWLSLPQCCRQSHQITLEKGTNASLGFSIVGGNDSTHGPQPIYVKTVVSNGVAAKNGLLKCGDIIESVNSVSLLDISHKEAVTLLKNIQQRAQLTIVSWPGTII
nr:ligand of Numb protein X 2-like [Lytechinus pictus]